MNLSVMIPEHLVEFIARIPKDKKDNLPMKLNVAYIITPNFGSVFSGPTRTIFTMLSGWQNEEITLELLGTKIKVLNLNSGKKDYKLSENMWSEQRRTTKTDRFLWTIKVFWLISKHMRQVDIFHFMTLNRWRPICR
jgi:hypothetical protein